MRQFLLHFALMLRLLEAALCKFNLARSRPKPPAAAASRASAQHGQTALQRYRVAPGTCVLYIGKERISSSSSCPIRNSIERRWKHLHAVAKPLDDGVFVILQAHVCALPPP